MWAPPVNNSGHSPLSTAEPKWVPYRRTNNILADIPPEGSSSNVMARNPEMMPVRGESANDYNGGDQPVVRRIASAPLQYQELISREHSVHLRSSKATAKRRPKADPTKSQTPPRIKASVSTISWREELTHYKSTQPPSPQQTRPAIKTSDQKGEENQKSKDSARLSAQLNDRNYVKISASSNVNGKKSGTSTDAKLSSLNTGTNGPQSSNSNHRIPQTKTEIDSQIEDDPLSHLMESISAVRKLANVTRSHMDVSDKGSVMQSKKRSSSENNLTTQKHDDRHKVSGHRASSLSGKLRYEGLKASLISRASPKKPEILSKKNVEVSEPIKEKRKGYDPEKAREYIKQQRCERLSSIREEKERKKAHEEAKKQKLSELDQKRHQLLQANIKKKPHQPGEDKNQSGPPPKTEDLKAPAPASILVAKQSAPRPRPATASTTESGLYVFPGPPHPVVKSATSDPVITIKDINDMKAKIENLAKSLKNALGAGTKKKAPTVVNLHDGVELRLGEKVEIAPKPKPILIDEVLDTAEVNQLTDNLRKKREDFRNVLAQNLNVRRPKMKKAEERFEAETERLQQWLQKIPTAASAQVPHKRIFSGSSSEIDRAGVSDLHRRHRRRRTKSNILLHGQQHGRTRSLTRRRETSDDSEQENLSGGPLDTIQSPPPKSESDTGSIPEWLKPLTQDPYPVNFMSVVKRKMAANKTELEAPPITLTFSTANQATKPAPSQPIASHVFSSSSHQNPFFIPPLTQESIFDERPLPLPLPPPTNGLLFDLFPAKTTTTLVAKSQQTTPKETPAISPEGSRDSEKDHSWSGQIINTSVPPLPRLSSTTTEGSSRVISPEVSATTPVPKTGYVEGEKEPAYESDFESARKSGEDTDAPSMSSEHRPADSESIRLVTPNVDLYSDWSSRRDCGDGENASQESATQNGKESFEIGRLYNPEAIHLQFQAELNRLDAFNESLYHVMEVEKVRAVALAREQAMLSTKPTSEQPSPKSDKAVSVQKSLADVSTVNYARGSSEVSTVTYTRGAETPPKLDSAEVLTESIQTDIAGNEISTESPSSPVATSQPSSVPEKSVSPQSSDATISEDIRSQKSPHEAVRPHKEKGQPKRLKLRQTDKISSDARGSKVEDESTELSVPETNRTGDAVAGGKSERSDRRSGLSANTEDAFQFTLQMLEQLMYEEELRVQHKRTLLKLRERVLCDMAKAECASLDLDKKKLRDIGGQEEQISALRKKQRGVLMKFQQQRDEITSMQRTDELVWKERRLMYLRQLHLYRMQMSTRSLKNRRDEDGAALPKNLLPRGVTGRRDLDLDNTPDFNALLATASLSSPSAASDISIPLPANTSGDTESSCVDERPIKDLELRSRTSRDRDPLDPLRQPVDLWRRRLEEEERRLRDVDRQALSRHKVLHMKHSLKDRSTSPFQFSDMATNFSRASGNGKQRSRISNGSAPEDDSSVPEDIADQPESNMSSVKEALSAAAVSEYTESFESIESDAKTAESQSGTGEVLTQSNGSKETSVKKASSSLSERSVTKQPLLHEKSKGHPSVTIKIPLSPRLQRVQRRRYSSGSDDSIVFSQTETGSEQSDIEGRISALTEQLEQRKAEAERLRREAKRTRCERLLAKEQSLQKQLQAYDVYISQARQNLDAELKQTSVPIVRPQIKQPRVASSGKVKSPNTAQQSEQDVSIQDSVAESSASQDSSLDAATLSPSKQNGADLEFGLPEHSGVKDVISDAMSTVPSDVASGDISEVSSENGSTESNENASLVANMGGKHEVAVKKAVVDAGSDTLSNAGSDVASEVATDVLSEMDSSACTEIIDDVINKQEDAAKQEQVSKHTEESNEASTVPSPVLSDNGPVEKADASDSFDAEDLIEGANEANFIKVVLKEKDKGDEKLDISPELPAEDSALNKEQRAALVDKITDSILQVLLNDCVQNTKSPNNSMHSPVTSRTMTQVQEDDDHSASEKVVKRTEKTKDVRTRVHEILAETIQSPSPRSESRIQDLMVTTYDVLSPDDSPCSSPHQGSPTRQIPDSSLKSPDHADSRIQTPVKLAENSAEKLSVLEYNGSSDPSSIFNDSFQDWLDEECNGSSEPEAELLRLQQLQIEQRIQQLDQQIDQLPYILREIPNKPPPPYTPPGQAPRVLATSVPCSPPLEEIRAVTKSQSEILQAVDTATDMLYEAYRRKQDLKSVVPPESFLSEGYTVPEHVKLCEQDLQIHRNSARVHRIFLFDLARQIVEEAFSHEQEQVCPPWLQPENVFSRRKALAEAPRSRQELQQVVSRQALALFGFGPRAEKENLTIRWSRKKRDHVDELLVRELQEEERQWTSYEYDEAVIKNNVTESILEALLADTTEVVKEIFQRRQRRLTDIDDN